MKLAKPVAWKVSLFAIFALNNSKFWLLAIVIAVAVGFLGYLAGDRVGYARSQIEVKKAQELAGQKAGEDAAAAANPFKGTNPLEGVETNPFEEAKKVLNPFN